MSVAVIQLVIPTPAQPEPTLASVADNLRHGGRLADYRALAIDNLRSSGWELLKVIADASDDFNDIVVFAHKEFASADDAEDEAKACGCREALSFSFLWNWDGTFDDNGYPNYEWGGECA